MRTPTEEHGTYAKFRQGCDCQPCRQAKGRYEKGLRLDHERGIRRRVDPARAREHVLELLTHGVTCTQVGRAAGLAHSRVRDLVNGKQGRPVKWIFRPTEQALLGVTLASITPEHGYGKVEANVGYRRRIEALNYMGHSQAQISREMGYGVSNVNHHLNVGPKVRTTSVQRLDEVYRRLRDVEADGTQSASRTKWTAYYKGYAPPMAWDDESIDDPAAQPIEVGCVMATCTRPAVKHNLCMTHLDRLRRAGELGSVRSYHCAVDRLGEQKGYDGARTRREIAELEDFGYGTKTIAERLGIDEDYIVTLKTKRAA